MAIAQKLHCVDYYYGVLSFLALSQKKLHNSSKCSTSMNNNNIQACDHMKMTERPLLDQLSL